MLDGGPQSGVLTKPGTTIPGHNDMGLGLRNKVKNRVRD